MKKEEMTREEIHTENQENTEQPKKLSGKVIWGIVLLLLLCVVVSAAIFIPRLKKAAPTDGEDVIALLPETVGDEGTASGENGGTAGDASAAGESAGTGQDAASDASGTADSIRRVGGTTTLYSKMTVEDKKQVWQSSTSVDIFRKYYEGARSAGMEGKITVENDGSDDKKLIAPGTENTYTFWVKNPGQTVINYRVFFHEESDGYKIPIQVRLKCGNTYVFGTDDSWEEIGLLNSFEHASQLAPKNYASYTLEWRWPYRTESSFDTFLGNKATKKDIEQMILICTYGESDGTEETRLLGAKTGDDTIIWLWVLLAVLAAAAAVYMAGRMSKDRREADE